MKCTYVGTISVFFLKAKIEVCTLRREFLLLRNKTCKKQVNGSCWSYKSGLLLFGIFTTGVDSVSVSCSYCSGTEDFRKAYEPTNKGTKTVCGTWLLQFLGKVNVVNKHLKMR